MNGIANEINQMLTKLDEYQIDKVIELITIYLNQNNEINNVYFEYCPKCHKFHPVLVKAGFTEAGTPRLRCLSCGKKFVYNIDNYTYRSHQPQSVWNQVIVDTLMLKSIVNTANKTNLNEETIYNMRHKILHALEVCNIKDKLDGLVEIDEKFIKFNHKGEKIDGVKSNYRGNPASKAGVSNEQSCLITGVDRTGHSFVAFENMGAPKSSDIIDACINKIQPNIEIITDGNTSYNKLAHDTNSLLIVCKTHKSYIQEKHLNNVNSFHNKIETCKSKYRGFATKHSKRYGALFASLWNNKSIDFNQLVLDLLVKLKKTNTYISIKDLKNESNSEEVWILKSM